MSSLIPEDIVRLAFQELNLRSATIASLTCKHYMTFVWASFTKITPDFFVVLSHDEDSAAAQSLVQNATDTVIRIIPFLSRVTHLSTGSRSRRAAIPKSKFFAPLLPRLKGYSVHDMDDLVFDDLVGLDENQLECLEAMSENEYQWFDDPLQLETVIDAKTWPKLKHVRLDSQIFQNVFKVLLSKTPNLETLVLFRRDNTSFIHVAEGAFISDAEVDALRQIVKQPSLRWVSLEQPVPVQWQDFFWNLAPLDVRQGLARNRRAPLEVWQQFIDWSLLNQPDVLKKLRLFAESSSLWDFVWCNLMFEYDASLTKSSLDSMYALFFPRNRIYPFETAGDTHWVDCVTHCIHVWVKSSPPSKEKFDITADIIFDVCCRADEQHMPVAPMTSAWFHFVRVAHDHGATDLLSKAKEKLAKVMMRAGYSLSAGGISISELLEILQ